MRGFSGGVGYPWIHDQKWGFLLGGEPKGVGRRLGVSKRALPAFFLVGGMPGEGCGGLCLGFFWSGEKIFVPCPG